MEDREMYRPTQFWNDVLRTFRSSMPTKRHRRQWGFRSYDDTFSGNEATDYMHKLLIEKRQMLPLSVNTVSRCQALALLNMIYKKGVFDKAVEIKYNSTDADSMPVKDDSTLYRFSDGSSSRFTQTPLALKLARPQSMSRADVLAANINRSNNNIQQHQPRPITPIRYRPVAASPRCDNMSVAVEQAATAETIDSDLVDVHSVSSPNFGSHELVSVTADECEALTARRCLSYDASILQETVTTTDELLTQEQQVGKNSPLLDEQLHSNWTTFLKARLCAELRYDGQTIDELLSPMLPINGDDIMWNSLKISRDGVVLPREEMGDGASVGLLSNHMVRAMRFLCRWPFGNHELGTAAADSPGLHIAAFQNIIEFFHDDAALNGGLISADLASILLKVISRCEILDVADLQYQRQMETGTQLHEEPDMTETTILPYPTDDKGKNNSAANLPKVRLSSRVSVQPSSARYETEFGADDQAKTFPLSSNNPPTSWYSERRRIVEMVAKTPTDEELPSNRVVAEAIKSSSVGGLRSLPGLVRSPELLKRVQEVREKLDSEPTSSTLTGYTGVYGPPVGVVQTVRSHQRRSTVISLDGGGSRLSWTQPTTASNEFGVTAHPHFLRHSVTSIPSAYDFLTPAKSEHGATGSTSLLTPLPLADMSSVEERRRLTEALRLCLLVMSPMRRRRLHLLLIFMHKVSRNHCLPPLAVSADPRDTHGNRYVVLKALSGCVVSAPGLLLYSSVVRLSALLMDIESEVFAPSTLLNNTVSTQLNRSTAEKLRYGSPPLTTRSPPTEPTPVQYCEPITEVEYRRGIPLGELQVDDVESTTGAALVSLLKHIVANENMKPKLKEKRLKEFELDHPAVYVLVCPKGHTPVAKKSKRKVDGSQSLTTSMFNKLKLLRK